MEFVHGNILDISLYILHKWYNFIYLYDLADKTEKLGRWLGPSGEAFGGGDCHYMLYKTRKVHVTNSTCPLHDEEWQNREEDRSS